MTKNQAIRALQTQLSLMNVYCALVYSAGPAGKPNGELYAEAMTHGVDLDAHNRTIDMLKQASMVKESNYLLTWIGPADWSPEPVQEFCKKLDSKLDPEPTSPVEHITAE